MSSISESGSLSKSQRGGLVVEECSSGLLPALEREFQSGKMALRDADFFLLMRECILNGMEKVLGKSGVASTSYYVELATCIERPAKFYARLSSLYRSGTWVLENAILTELFGRIGLSFRRRKGYSYPDYVYEAGRVFLIKKSDSCSR